MTWVFDDGGRRLAGYKGTAGDCAVRAVAITACIPYEEVYAELFALEKAKRRRKGSGPPSRRSPRNGVRGDVMRAYMEAIGATWTPTMFIGSGCQVHMRADELPAGRLVLSVSRHVCAWIDGTLHDIYDCSRDGTRCVYGYWQVPIRKLA